MPKKRQDDPVAATATLRYHRGSPQKAGLVIDQIRGKQVNDALNLLRFSPKVASKAIGKLLRSAVANAERSEQKVDVDNLYVGAAYVGPGSSLKRSRGRAFGRAFRILHRSCHITVKLNARTVAPKPDAKPAAGAAGAKRKATGGGKAARKSKTGSTA